MKWLIYGSLTILLVLAAAGAYITVSCPCDRLPGVMLLGEEVPEPIEDWSFVNETGLCQVQVSNGVLPQSLNLNCMSADGELFVSCSRCAAKRWSNTALANPAGYIRVDGRVYPVRFSRLVEADQLDHAWATRADKLLKAFNREVDGNRPDHWWSFQLVSR